MVYRAKNDRRGKRVQKQLHKRKEAGRVKKEAEKAKAVEKEGETRGDATK